MRAIWAKRNSGPVPSRRPIRRGGRRASLLLAGPGSNGLRRLLRRSSGGALGWLLSTRRGLCALDTVLGWLLLALGAFLLLLTLSLTFALYPAAFLRLLFLLLFSRGDAVALLRLLLLGRGGGLSLLYGGWAAVVCGLLAAALGDEVKEERMGRRGAASYLRCAPPRLPLRRLLHRMLLPPLIRTRLHRCPPHLRARIWRSLAAARRVGPPGVSGPRLRRPVKAREHLS